MPDFSSLSRLLRLWYLKNGRKNLPWQIDPSPYRVWISEIMLQQTQVATVIPYYLRFMTRFPDLSILASASLDEVLSLWAGLGYYSRARNLHKAANLILQHFNGQFPDHLESLVSLPGIGRSTAGAILALSYEKYAVILDGNVKRVLARVAKIEAPINEGNTQQKLWDLAAACTPKKHLRDHTQAMMDLGALICTRGNPKCELCPLTSLCLSFKAGVAHELPRSKSKKPLPQKYSVFFVIEKNNQIFLEKRAHKGIWGGLYALPEVSLESSHYEEKALKTYCFKKWGISLKTFTALPPISHIFTHFRLLMIPLFVSLKKETVKLMANEEQIWYNLTEPTEVGLPKPIQSILRGLL